VVRELRNNAHLNRLVLNTECTVLGELPIAASQARCSLSLQEPNFSSLALDAPILHLYLRRFAPEVNRANLSRRHSCLRVHPSPILDRDRENDVIQWIQRPHQCGSCMKFSSSSSQCSSRQSTRSSKTSSTTVSERRCSAILGDESHDKGGRLLIPARESLMHSWCIVL
jgi:hypothetical protein